MKHSREKIEKLILYLENLGLFNEFEKSEICGSYRRQKQQIGDLDIVIIPKSISGIEKVLEDNNVRYKKRTLGYQFHIDEVKVDLFIASENNFWMNVFMWTGSYYFTMKIRALYNRRGYRLTTHAVSSNASRQILSDKFYFDEEKIFSFIGIDYIPPEKRG